MSSAVALARLGFPAAPALSITSTQAVTLRKMHSAFATTVLELKSLFICNPAHIRPLVRGGGKSMSKAGPSAPPSEHAYKALVPPDVHRTIT